MSSSLLKLVNCSLIDVERGGVKNNAVIVVVDGIIRFVGSESEAQRYGEGALYDAKNNYVLPGLCDLHTHIAFDGTPYAWSMNSLFKEKTAFRAVKAVWEAYKHLRSGFTTIRDLGSMDYIDIGVREAIIKGLVVGPNIYTSGKALSMTGGHGDLWVRDDVSGPTFGLIVNGVESVRFATRMLVRQGADWIKVLGTGGVASEGDYPDSPQFTREELLAVAYEAHAAKRKVAVHAHGPAGIQLALESGADTIEHGSMLAEQPELALEMARKNAALVPTLSVTSAVVSRGAAEGLPEYAIRKTEGVIDLQRKSVKLARENGVLIGLGTDAGYMQRHGESASELDLLVKSGLSPLEAIRAGTINAAKILGNPLIGNIKEGCLADIIVVKSNPLEDIAKLKDESSIVDVFKGGKRISRERGPTE